MVIWPLLCLNLLSSPYLYSSSRLLLPHPASQGIDPLERSIRIHMKYQGKLWFLAPILGPPLRWWEDLKDDIEHDSTYRARKKQRKARKKAYETYVLPPLEPLPATGSRTQSLSRQPQTRISVDSQLNSKLLSLPTEIRHEIWKYAMSGMNIVIYRAKGRLTHCLLDHSNAETPGELRFVSPESIRYAVMERTNPPSTYTWDSPPREKNMKLNSLLKTCRMM